MILASIGNQLAEYLSTLIYVYTLLIVLYIVIQLLFSLCATSASRSCASSVAFFPPSVGSTSARCSRS
jgi:hypothetical protein